MKKFSALLLALLMMVMTVTAGIAEDLFPEVEPTGSAKLVEDALAAGRRVTSTLKLSDWPAGLTGDESIDAMINDVLNALTITTYEQGDEGSFALSMSGNDVLTIGGAQSGNDTYLSSNLLGGTIVVAADEWQIVAERLVDLFVMMGMFEEDDAAEVKAALAEVIDMVAAEMNSMTAVPEFNFDITTLNLTALEKIITKVTEKIQIGEVTMQPKNCDPATVVASITVTPGEAKAGMKAIMQFLQDNPALVDAVAEMMSFDEMMAQAGETMTLNEAIAEAAKEVKNTDFLGGNAVANIYMNDAGEVVAMTGTAPIKNEDGEVATVEGNYSRLTVNEGVTHTMTIVIEGVTMTINVLESDSRIYVGFNMNDEETTLFVTVDVTNADTENELNSVYSIAFGVEDPEMTMTIAVNGSAVYTVNGVDFVGKEAADVLLNDMKLLHIECDTVSGEAGASIMTGDVVRPAELNENDFANWFVGIVNGLSSWLGTVIMSLPESVLMLIMGSM